MGNGWAIIRDTVTQDAFYPFNVHGPTVCVRVFDPLEVLYPDLVVLLAIIASEVKYSRVRVTEGFIRQKRARLRTDLWYGNGTPCVSHTVLDLVFGK